MNGIRHALRAVILVGLTAITVNSLAKPEAIAFEAGPVSPSSLGIAQASSISSGTILREINRLRSNPAAYADWLETTRSYYDGAVLSWPRQPRIQTQEGTYALDEAIAILRQTPSLPPLELSDGLTRAADDHVKDLLENNRFSTAGSDGSTSENRIERYGFYEGDFQELLSQDLADPVAIVMGLVVNDGNSTRSYRQALLKADFRYIGIAIRG